MRRALRHTVLALAAACALGASTPACADPVTIVTVAAYAAGSAGVMGMTMAIASYIALGASIIGGLAARKKAKRAAASAREAQAAAMTDRCVTLMTAEPEPRVVYGRCAVGGWVIDKITTAKTYVDDSGNVKTKPDAYQHVVIGIACHEVHAIHDVYMYGDWVGTIGADGWVTGGPADAPYGKTAAIQTSIPLTFVAGAATIPQPQQGYTVSRLIAISQDGSSSGAVSHTGATLSGLSITGGPASGQWTVSVEITKVVSSLRVEFFTGSPDQQASAYLMSVAPGVWTSAHRLRGIAWGLLTFDLDDARHQGIPSDLAFDVSGRKVLDPRTGVTAWSRNSALCTNDWLRAPWGYSLGVDDIDAASVVAAANASDQQVTLSVGGVTTTGPRYTMDGAFGVNADKSATLSDMLETMGGFASQSAQWAIHAGAWTAPVMDLVDDDLAGPIRIIRSHTPIDERFNAAKASYMPERKVQPSEVDPYINTVFVAADGGREWGSFTLPFTNNKARGRNLLRQFVEQSRAGMIIQYTGKMRLWPLQVGDRVTVTSSRFGLVADTFRVLDWSWSPGQPVVLTLQRDIAASYDDADASTADPAPATRLPNPGLVDTPSGFSAASGSAHLLKMADGTIVPRVFLAWNAPQTIYMSDPSARTVIAWRRAGETTWNELAPLPGNSTAAYLDTVRDRDVILVRLCHVNSFGVRSVWSTLAHSVVGKSAAPTAPTALTVTETLSGQRIFQLAHVQDLDHAGYVIRYSADLAAAYDQMTQVAVMWAGDALAGQSALPADGTYRFAVVAYDSSGNTSAAVYATATLSAVSELAAGGDNLVQIGFFRAVGQQTAWSAPVIAVMPAGSTAWPYALDVSARDTIEWQAGFPVASGDAIYVEADATTWRTPVPMTLGLLLRKADGTQGFATGADGAPTKAGETGWSHLAGKITIPTGGWIKAWPWIQLDTPLGSTQPSAWVSNIIMTRAQLGATNGADWATNVVGRPANIAGLTGGEQIKNSQISQSGNLLANTIFAGQSTVSWAHYGPATLLLFGTESQRDPLQPYSPPGSDAIVMRQGAPIAGGDGAIARDLVPEFVACKPTMRFEFSAYLAAHRCNAQVFLEFFDAAKAVIPAATVSWALGVNVGGQALDLFTRAAVFGVAPAGAAYVRPMVRKMNTWAGQADSYMWLLKPYLGVAGADQTVPSEYSPGVPSSHLQLGAIRTEDVQPGAATDVIVSSFSSVYLSGPTDLSVISIGPVSYNYRALISANFTIEGSLPFVSFGASKVVFFLLQDHPGATNPGAPNSPVIGPTSADAVSMSGAHRHSLYIPAGVPLTVKLHGVPMSGTTHVSGVTIVEVIKL